MSNDSTEFLSFREAPASASGKTRVVDVLNRRHEYRLGHIRWWPAWRQYTFLPEPDMVFSAGCLTDVDEKLKAMNKAHKEQRARAIVLAAFHPQPDKQEGS